MCAASAAHTFLFFEVACMSDSVIDYLEKQETGALIGMLMSFCKDPDQYGYAIPTILDILKKRDIKIPSHIKLPVNFLQ